MLLTVNHRVQSFEDVVQRHRRHLRRLVKVTCGHDRSFMACRPFKPTVGTGPFSRTQLICKLDNGKNWKSLQRTEMAMGEE